MEKISRGQGLYNLIRSLSAKELQYFRRYTSGFGKDGGSLYQLVFEHMRAQATWSEQALRKMLEERGMNVQLGVTYIYLRQKIIEALRQYDTSNSYLLQASRLLDAVTMFWEREQLEPCRLAIVEAKKYAMKLDLPQMELQLIAWELRLLRNVSEPASWEQIGVLAARAERLEKDIQIENALQVCFSRLYALVAWPSRSLPGDRSALVKAIAEHPALQEDPATLRFDAALLYYNIRSQLAKEGQDNLGFAEANEHKVQLWSQHDARMTMEPKRYVMGLIGAAESDIEVEKYQAATIKIKDVKRFFEHNKAFRIKYGLLVLHLELRVHLNSPSVDKAIACATTIPGFGQIRPGAVPKYYIEVCTNAAYAYFMAGIWSNCLHFLAKAEVLTKQGARMEFIVKALPLRLMAMYSAGNDGLERAIRTWSKSAGNSVEVNTLAKIFLELYEAFDEEAKQAALQELLNALDKIVMDAGVRRLMRNWTLARLQGRPMRDFYPDAQP